MRWILGAALAAAMLAGCASGVKLDEVPVEDRGAGATGAGAGGAAGGTGVGKGNVAQVDLGSTGNGTAAAASAARVVYFDYDSFVIKPEFQGLIETHARFLKADRKRKVVIEGHTDERGGREYNLALGQKRSEAVRRALGLQGVEDAQTEAVSFGKEKPAATGSDEVAMAQNRRAEMAFR